MVGQTAPQPDARERKWQNQCRAIYPDWYILHHCRERNTRFVEGVYKIPIGHLFINMLDPADHDIIQSPDRRDQERRNFEDLVERVKQVYSVDIVITKEEIQACMNYMNNQEHVK